jgi:hypothetical protein
MSTQQETRPCAALMRRTELQPADVFGVTTKMPLNYVSRPEVDGELLSELARNRHIVIHGSSKQGKTCLRRKILAPDSYIEINCLHSMTLANIHQRILEKARYIPTKVQSATESSGETQGRKTRRGIKASALEAGVDSDRTTSHSKETSTRAESWPVDLSDANVIGEILSELNFNKTIVLDDFHFLSVKVQREFAFALNPGYS